MLSKPRAECLLWIWMQILLEEQLVKCREELLMVAIVENEVQIASLTQDLDLAFTGIDLKVEIRSKV